MWVAEGRLLQGGVHRFGQNGRGLKGSAARWHDELYLQVCTGINRHSFKIGRNKPCFASKVII